MWTARSRRLARPATLIAFAGCLAAAGCGHDMARTALDLPQAPTPTAAERSALEAARDLTDPAARLDALRDIRRASPHSGITRLTDEAILTTLLGRQTARPDELAKAFDDVTADIAQCGTVSQRLDQTLAIVQRLIDSRMLLEQADTAVAHAIVGLTGPSRARGLETLATLAGASGKPDVAERRLREALEANPRLASVALALGRIEAARGEHPQALAHYLTVAAGGQLRAVDEAVLRDLYRRVRGDDSGLIAAIDRVYDALYPNPIEPASYRPSRPEPARTALAELCTGSACPTCVASSLAVDALIEAYPPDALAIVEYHVPIPAPDPLTTNGGAARCKAYGVQGVPALRVDGGPVIAGGGSRDLAARTYADYQTAIDRALAVPADGALAVQASSRGDRVAVTATVSAPIAGAGPLRLQLLLVERRVRFPGENGIRFHPMVVRAVAGRNGEGLTLNRGEATVPYLFDLASASSDSADAFSADLAANRRRPHPGEPRAPFSQPTEIDSSALLVVAFLQAADGKVLQAARSDVVSSGGNQP